MQQVPLTLHQAIVIRDRLDDQINATLTELDQEVKSKGKKIKTKVITGLFKQLYAVNEVIKNKKAEIEGKKTGCYRRCFGDRIRPVVVGGIALTFLVWGAQSAISIWRISEGKDDNSASNVAQLVISIAGEFLTAGVAGAWKAISDENESYDLTSRISRIEEQGEQNYIALFEAIKDLKKDQQKDAEEQKRFLTSGLRQLQNLPSGGFGDHISKEAWINSMLGMLPREHPITRKIEHLGQSAKRMQRRPPRIPTPRRSSSSSEKTEPFITAEMMGSPIFGPQPDIKHALEATRELARPPSPPFLVRSREMSSSDYTATGAASPPPETTEDETPSTYREKWRELEDELGIRIDCPLNVEDGTIDRQCNIVPIAPDHTILELDDQFTGNAVTIDP